jgi:hypothetical protein
MIGVEEGGAPVEELVTDGAEEEEESLEEGTEVAPVTGAAAAEDELITA